MKFWGITGTNGKTTTAWIFAEFLNSAPGRKCGYVTTVEVWDGKDRYYTGYTTPPLATLHEIYAKMESNGCTDCVMEVSSHAIHQKRTGDTVFAGGAFTNLSEDHLDYHKTMDEYFRVKLSFATWAQESYVVCTDGENGEKMLDAVKTLGSVCTIPVSFRTAGYDLSGLALAGDYNKSNVVTAAALAEAAGIDRATIQRVIPTLRPRWGRLELVENAAVKAKVYVDFAHTPDGLEKVLNAVRSDLVNQTIKQSKQSNNSLWVVFGAGGDRDPMKRPLMGEVCARIADRVVVTSDNPRSEDPTAIIDMILAGIPDAAAKRISGALVVEPDRRQAIEYALRTAEADDIVIIAGKGHETTQEIRGVKYPFDDREVVRNFT